MTTREMKSEKINRLTDDFWNWFSSIANILAANIEAPRLVKELDDRVQALDPKLSWEIGPGLSKTWQLVISPNLNRDLQEKAREIVARAPELTVWEFHSARQPKNWDFRLELKRVHDEPVHLDASGWTFVLLRYPGGAHEVLLKGDDLPDLGYDERWQAAAIVLESILGEEAVLDRINEFELVNHLEPRFVEKQKPIQHLRKAFESD